MKKTTPETRRGDCLVLEEGCLVKALLLKQAAQEGAGSSAGRGQGGW